MQTAVASVLAKNMSLHRGNKFSIALIYLSLCFVISELFLLFLVLGTQCFQSFVVHFLLISALVSCNILLSFDTICSLLTSCFRKYCHDLCWSFLLPTSVYLTYFILISILCPCPLDLPLTTFIWTLFFKHT